MNRFLHRLRQIYTWTNALGHTNQLNNWDENDIRSKCGMHINWEHDNIINNLIRINSSYLSTPVRTNRNSNNNDNNKYVSLCVLTSCVPPIMNWCRQLSTRNWAENDTIQTDLAEQSKNMQKFRKNPTLDITIAIKKFPSKDRRKQ